jgi:hypothetical protein
VQIQRVIDQLPEQYDASSFSSPACQLVQRWVH